MYETNKLGSLLLGECGKDIVELRLVLVEPGLQGVAGGQCAHRDFYFHRLQLNGCYIVGRLGQAVLVGREVEGSCSELVAGRFEGFGVAVKHIVCPFCGVVYEAEVSMRCVCGIVECRHSMEPF